jgi:hypothetical protein
MGIVYSFPLRGTSPIFHEAPPEHPKCSDTDNPMPLAKQPEKPPETCSERVSGIETALRDRTENVVRMERLASEQSRHEAEVPSARLGRMIPLPDQVRVATGVRRSQSSRGHLNPARRSRWILIFAGSRRGRPDIMSPSSSRRHYLARLRASRVSQLVSEKAGVLLMVTTAEKPVSAFASTPHQVEHRLVPPIGLAAGFGFHVFAMLTPR